MSPLKNLESPLKDLKNLLKSGEPSGEPVELLKGLANPLRGMENFLRSIESPLRGLESSLKSLESPLKSPLRGLSDVSQNSHGLSEAYQGPWDASYSL